MFTHFRLDCCGGVYTPIIYPYNYPQKNNLLRITTSYLVILRNTIMKNYSIKLPEELAKAILREASKKDRSMSYMIRKVLEDAFQPTTAQQAPTPQKKEKLTPSPETVKRLRLIPSSDSDVFYIDEQGIRRRKKAPN